MAKFNVHLLKAPLHQGGAHCTPQADLLNIKHVWMVLVHGADVLGDRWSARFGHNVDHRCVKLWKHAYGSEEERDDWVRLKARKERLEGLFAQLLQIISIRDQERVFHRKLKHPS